MPSNPSPYTKTIDRLRDLPTGSAGLPPGKPPLNNDGGGGRFPDMEGRIANLEAHMDHVRSGLDRLADVPQRLTAVEVKLDHLPSKEWTFKTLAAMLAALAIIVGLIVRFIPHA